MNCIQQVIIVVHHKLVAIITAQTESLVTLVWVFNQLSPNPVTLMDDK